MPHLFHDRALFFLTDTVTVFPEDERHALRVRGLMRNH
jgi:hypothetical protein